MSYILTNALPILLATLAGLALGVAWTKASRHAPARPLGAGFALLAFAAEFWLAAILAGALILAPPQAGEWVMAVMTPVVIWAGFVLPALAVTLPWQGEGVARTASLCALWLATMVLQAVVLKLIGLTPPVAPA